MGFADEDVWHGELDDDERTHKKYLLVRQEGKRPVQKEIFTRLVGQKCLVARIHYRIFATKFNF